MIGHNLFKKRTPKRLAYCKQVVNQGGLQPVVPPSKFRGRYQRSQHLGLVLDLIACEFGSGAQVSGNPEGVPFFDRGGLLPALKAIYDC